MARTTSFSDEAFLALREEKRPGESDSDVLLRLRREARRKRKDFMRFFTAAPRFDVTEEEHAALIERMREADRSRDAWRDTSAGARR